MGTSAAPSPHGVRTSGTHEGMGPSTLGNLCETSASPSPQAAPKCSRPGRSGGSGTTASLSSAARTRSSMPTSWCSFSRRSTSRPGSSRSSASSRTCAQRRKTTSAAARTSATLRRGGTVGSSTSLRWLVAGSCVPWFHLLCFPRVPPGCLFSPARGTRACAWEENTFHRLSFAPTSRCQPPTRPCLTQTWAGGS